MRGPQLARALLGTILLAVASLNVQSDVSAASAPADRAGEPTVTTAPGVGVDDVACAGSSGVCFAVGYNVIEELRDGQWTASVPPVPSGFEPGPDVLFTDVSCGAARLCAAIGSVGVTPILDEWNGSTWVSRSLNLPSNVSHRPNSVGLDAVTCSGPQSCVAVGGYTTRSGRNLPLLITYRAGHWHGEAGPLPAGAHRFGVWGGVSCARDGDSCEVVGNVGTPDGSSLPLVLTLSGGSWKAETLAVPDDAKSRPLAQLLDIACPSADRCTAVGRYQARGLNVQGLVELLRNGVWAVGRVRAPRHGPGRLVILDHVGCSSPRHCVAVGGFGSEGHRGEPLVTLLTGTRARSLDITPATGQSGSGALLDIVCLPHLSCEAVGDQGVGFAREGLLVSVRHGRVTTAALPVPPGVLTPELVSIDAQTPTSAVAIGGAIEPYGPGEESLLVTGIGLGH